MAQGHWLDPLARQVLRVLKQPPTQTKKTAATPLRVWQIDVNRASLNDWLKLPSCQQAQAELLLRLQKGGVQLSGPADLAQLLELPAATVISGASLVPLMVTETVRSIEPPLPSRTLKEKVSTLV